MKKVLLVNLFLLFTTAAFAGDPARKGTTGADQLLIPVGAKGIATGGAFLANLTGIEAIYYNPAGLDVTHRTEAMFSYMSYIADINISYFAVSASLGDLGSIGLSFKTFDFGEILITTSDFPDGTGETYSPAFLTAGLTYSKVITDRITVGTNLKLISETIENTSASGFAVDVGVQYKFSNQISLGASIKNIGTNMSYSGSDLVTRTEIPGSSIGTKSGTYQVLAEDFQIPSYFDLSLSYNFNLNEQNNILLGSTFVANNSLEDYINFGGEYGFMNTFFLRGGYNLLIAENIGKESIYGFTAGAGVEYKIAGNVAAAFDYAFRDVEEFPTSNHIFTVKLAFE